MSVDNAAGRGLLGAVAFFQDAVHHAVVKGDNPLLLGFNCQEGFIGFLVGVGSFLFHLRMRIYGFFVGFKACAMSWHKQPLALQQQMM